MPKFVEVENDFIKLNVIGILVSDYNFFSICLVLVFYEQKNKGRFNII